MTELQKEVEEIRKLTWALTKKVSELAAKLNAKSSATKHVVFTDCRVDTINTGYDVSGLLDEDDKGKVPL